MGIKDAVKNIFGRKKKDEEDRPIVEEKRDIAKISHTEEGRKIFELQVAEKEKGQYSDTTRIVIDKVPQNVEGALVYDCMATWYNEGDTMFYDPSGSGEINYDYVHVIAGIDPYLMETNKEYFFEVMKGLFKESRVKGEYLPTRLKTEEEIEQEATRIREEQARVQREGGDPSTIRKSQIMAPCGRYIGCVIEREGRIVRGFNPDVGKALHNSPEMKKEREAYKERQARQEVARAKREEIARMQHELDEYENETYGR